MKKILLTILMVFLFSYSVSFADQTRPEPSTSGSTFTNGITVGGSPSRITFDPSAEYIDGTTDDLILFQGVGGTLGDTNIYFNLDYIKGINVYPQIYSSDQTIEILDKLIVTSETITDPNSSGGNVTVHRMDADAFSGGVNTGIKVTNYISGSEWAGGSVQGGRFENACSFATGFLGPGGSANITSAGFFARAATGLSNAQYTTGNVFGAQIYTTGNYVTVSGDAIGLRLYDSNNTGTTIAGEETMLHIEEPQTGATKHQVILEGVGAGAGIWFDSAERIHSDGTNIVTVAPLKVTGGLLSDGGNAGIDQSETTVTSFDIVIENGIITSFTKN